MMNTYINIYGLIEIVEAKKSPIVYDEDCPELTPAMIKAFKCSAASRNCQKNKL